MSPDHLGPVVSEYSAKKNTNFIVNVLLHGKRIKPFSSYFIGVILISLLLIGNIFAQSSEIIDRAGFYLEAAEYEQAETLYREALQSDKDNIIALEGLLYVLDKRQKYKEILKTLEEQDPQTLSTTLWKAYARYETADYIRSIRDYKKSLRFGMYDEVIYAGLGWNYYRMGYYLKARDYFNKSQRSNPYYQSAQEGAILASRAMRYLYAQASWLDNKNITANPVLYLKYSHNNFQLFTITDYFEKNIKVWDYNLNELKPVVFNRTAFTGGFNYIAKDFFAGTNFYYLHSSNKYMYNAWGLLGIGSYSFETPYFLSDIGIAGGYSEYEIGSTYQVEIFNNILFNIFTLKTSIILTDFTNKKKEFSLLSQPTNLVYSLSGDYFISNYISINLTGSYGEKILMMNKNGYITDIPPSYAEVPYEVPEWETDMSINFFTGPLLTFIGTKYNSTETVSIYGGIGYTLSMMRQ